MNLGNNSKAGKYLPGFTIVELLIVIVVIGILAAVTIVAYTGIRQKAVIAELTSDLSGAATKLRLYQVDNGAYPDSLDCTTVNPAPPKICLRPSAGNSFVSYIADNTASPQTFSLNESNGDVTYGVTHTSSPKQITSILVTGGNVTTDGQYTVRTFSSNGTLTVTGGTISNATILVVGGGGGGGYSNGGGGGGGQVTTATVSLTGTMTVTVAALANGGNSGHTNGYAGNSSTFGGYTAIGGGYGAYGYGSSVDVNGGNGASGGGGAGMAHMPRGIGGTGNPGYSGGTYYGMGSGGGGGGMGSAGGDGDNSSGGAGGNGISSAISGSVQYYGAGGGGYGASGGSGVGGTGGYNRAGYDAVVNSGSGGGGADWNHFNGGAGAAGIVIVRYITP